jgi:hypothetical protein
MATLGGGPKLGKQNKENDRHERINRDSMPSKPSVYFGNKIKSQEEGSSFALSEKVEN